MRHDPFLGHDEKNRILAFFSREPRLYKRVCPSVGPSVGRSVGNLFFRRAETKTANDLFRVYELVHTVVTIS